MQTNFTDEELLTLLRSDADKAVELLFRQYYAYVCKTIYQVLNDEQVAEDIAQEVFFEVWRRKEQLTIKTSLRGYLRRAAVNRTLNYLRDRKIKWDDEPVLPMLEDETPGAPQHLEAGDLQRLIDEAIDALPEKCRVVFILSRQDELSYQEIANNLQISVKTVENQVSKALKHLRIALKPYLSDGLLILLSFWLY
ncbi:MAG TPA: RNA polymerase sigma-70 factor [Saprospiraceae bacterium]|nr:RNA polymerase sigma-70 factor [Saprospiraceae bacterium]HMP25805.1 RNA polymerase sigma-70 factor [Saprospiraceae bacterium]